jgi:hypothetical protein
MPLFLDDPVVVPASPEKEFPIAWIRSLQIIAHDPNAEGAISLEILPMSVDRELHFPSVINLKTDTLYAAMSEVPELQTAFAAILAAVKPLQAWVEANQTESP